MNETSNSSFDGISIFESDNLRTANKSVSIVFGVIGIILVAQLAAALMHPNQNGPVGPIVTAVFVCIIFVFFYLHRITTLIVLRSTQRTLTIQSTSHFGHKKSLLIDLGQLSFALQTIPPTLRRRKSSRLNFYVNSKKVHFIESGVNGWSYEALKKIILKLRELGVQQTLKQ